MNAGLVKKMRKYAAKNYKITLDNALDTVCQENILHRLVFAFKVIFRMYKKKSENNNVKSTNNVILNNK